MRALRALTIANMRSYLRDRQALFWTLAFPLIFVFLFGSIFGGGGSASRTVAWVDEDGTQASATLRAAFASVPGVKLVDLDRATALDKMRSGDNSGVIVVPTGYGDVVAGAATDPSRQTVVTYFVDPSQQTDSASMAAYVSGVLAQVNLGGRPVAVTSQAETIQTTQLTAVSYLVPSILGMALMQTGIFAAIPLVADRQKLILKRLAATPLKRWQLIGSNVILRLLIALVQFVLIVGVGVFAFDVKIVGSLVTIAGLAVLGSLAFTSLGYVIASLAKTEDAATGMTSAVQFPLMFLSGTFWP
ncbi:MAG: ABC transporter permease, partial [Chloroflexota bacterium]|nr:ABC transporter permease [Chloroflexota bacterium]